MILFENPNNSDPYNLFIEYYNDAIKSDQKNIDAVAISSYSKKSNEVSSRFVNIKYVRNDEWVFFSNYESKKALDFKTHEQIACLFFWPNTNSQIRMKSVIKKISQEDSDKHFFKRSMAKNALAICSKQSKALSSHDALMDSYEKTLTKGDLSKRPSYWGGYSFVPYYFEFWKGNDKRLNKRVSYTFRENKWHKLLLWP